MSESERKARPSVTFGRLMSGFSFVILLAAAGGIYLYFAHVAYARVAARHLPADTQLAVRVDVETMLVLEPLRTHLLPLFDLGAPSTTGLKPRHDRFRAHTGVDLARDLREVVVGIGSNEQDWVVILGGKFPPKGVIDGLEAVLAEEHVAARRERGAIALDSGPAIAQADDGALIVASGPACLIAALTGSQAYLMLGLPPEGAGGFAAALAGSSPATLAGLEQASGAFQLGGDIELDVALRFQGDQARPNARVADGVHGLASFVPVDSGLRRPLAAAQIQQRRPNEFGVRTLVRRDELDQGAGWLGRAIRAHFGALPEP
ncbi:MAG TPA: hypothetical protein VGM29_16770 [Polyangiaceae bacterium]